MAVGRDQMMKGILNKKTKHLYFILNVMGSHWRVVSKEETNSFEQITQLL